MTAEPPDELQPGESRPFRLQIPPDGHVLVTFECGGCDRRLAKEFSRRDAIEIGTVEVACPFCEPDEVTSRGVYEITD
jgi:hypothetical protein